MSQAAATKPPPIEHAPEYSKYVTLVAEGDIIQTLEQQIEKQLVVAAKYFLRQGQLPV